ncbi:MAG: Crp/Fnr family transcriptional regulator [Bacteroides sp.]|nr:Crp/Fnr family transcriptional regulator [Bacteroides sp.]MCM1414276.1 Crp/Fnr family transcriptional regulator [Bacteroides sp.]
MGSPIEHIEHIAIPDAVQDQIKNMMEDRHYRRGDIITDPTQLRDYAYYIKKGSARTYYIRNGKEVTYSFSFDDEFLTKPLSLLSVPGSSLAIQFMEPTEVIVLPIYDIHTVMEAHAKETTAESISYIISLLIDHTRIIEERLLIFQSMTAEERYHWFVNKYPTITKRATLTQIASFLGVAKETLYRIRAGKYKNK